MNRFQLRTHRFEALIRRYGVEFGELGAMVELLADARHWCDRHGESYCALDRLAQQDYLSELGELASAQRAS